MPLCLLLHLQFEDCKLVLAILRITEQLQEIWESG
jgi:hypothetical protein